MTRNVAALADPPALSAKRREEIKAWDASQLSTFLAAVEPHRLFPAFHLSAHTGMRRGEILGLRWGDIDWARQRIFGCATAMAGAAMAGATAADAMNRRRDNVLVMSPLLDGDGRYGRLTDFVVSY